MTMHWKVEQSGRFTVTTAVFEKLADADAAAFEFVAAATPDPLERTRLMSAVFAAPEGEPVTLPNGKRLEIIDLGEQF